jgi:hypothetical protein
MLDRLWCCKWFDLVEVILVNWLAVRWITVGLRAYKYLDYRLQGGMPHLHGLYISSLASHSHRYRKSGILVSKLLASN